jgi:hypothetical protein
MSEQIFCFGDGYAANHIWPEWPAILSVLYTSVKNYGAIGAGNEFITTSIIDAHRKNPDAFFIVQWAQHDRFDKLLEDSSWDFTISTDKIYNFNVVPVEQRKWWLSSASSQDEVRKYHDFYVQEQQSILRTDNSKYLIQRLLDNRALFFSTQEMESF